MKIFVSNFGKTYEIDIEEEKTIQELKEKLEEVTEIPCEEQILRIEGKFLYEKTLKENKLVEDTTINLNEINSSTKKTPNCSKYFYNILLVNCLSDEIEEESKYFYKLYNNYFCEKCFEKMFSEEKKQQMLLKGTLMDLKKEKEINLCNEHEKEIEGICKCEYFFVKIAYYWKINIKDMKELILKMKSLKQF